MEKLIDMHTHIYPEAIARKACENLSKFYRFPVVAPGVIEDLIDECKAFGFGGFLLLGVATNAHQVQGVNNHLAKAREQALASGLICTAFAAMHQDYTEIGAELDRCLALGLQGVKLHPDIQGVDIDDPRLLVLYREMEARHLPLCLHMGDERPEYRFSEAGKLKRVLSLFPTLQVIATHLGGYRAWEEAACLYGHDRVWYDLSSTLPFLSVEEAEAQIRRCGIDRVFFGSDYPIAPIHKTLEMFDKLPFTEQERKQLLFENAQRFLQEACPS